MTNSRGAEAIVGSACLGGRAAVHAVAFLGGGMAAGPRVQETIRTEQVDPVGCARLLRAALVRELDELVGIAPAVLLASRERRFSGLGGPGAVVGTAAAPDVAGWGAVP